jgi:hypothetical protein
VLLGERPRTLPGLDFDHSPDAALGLGHHLVGHHEDVASGEVLGRGGGDQLREVVPRPDRRERGERADAELAQVEACGTRAGPPTRSS